MISESSNREFRGLNQKFIDQTAKMIRFVLILLIIWTFITIAWTIHLLLNMTRQSNPSNPVKRYTRYKRSEESRVAYEELSFSTTISDVERDWDRMKAFIGSFHQLREIQGLVPKLTICTLKPLDQMKIEESSAWNKVKIVVSEKCSREKRKTIWI